MDDDVEAEGSQPVFAAIVAAVSEGDEEETAALVIHALEQGQPAAGILNGGLVAGMQALGHLFETGEVFLPEILVAAEAFDRGFAVLEPALRSQHARAKGRIVIGTVQGDLHDIGKNLVVKMLRGGGFVVWDLGVDVPAETFAAAAREHQAEIVGMSALLSSTALKFAEVIEHLTREGLRKKVKVMVGGAPVTQGLARHLGADGFAADCVSAVWEASRMVGSNDREEVGDGAERESAGRASR